MSVATARVAVGAGRDVLVREAERRAARRAAGVTIRIVRTVGGLYWAIFVAVAAAIIVGMTWFGSGLDVGILDAQLGGPSRWFMMVLGMIVPSAYLRLHVAAGGTRGALATGTVRGALVSGAMFGPVTAIYLVGERALFGALDQSWSRTYGLPVDGWAGIALTMLTESFVVATYYLVGAAISAGYHRLGMVRGTAYIVAALVPAALVDLATHTGVTTLVAGPEVLLGGGPGVLLSVAGGLVAIALAAWLFSLPLRSVQLRPQV
ncbi:hypothetical protein APR04_002511 [Promicromonospora umidemergens]|uniref:Uncharacterized protein n=1 Tax=Promicromonospora umidemergens TaxID=629679 RepID=A0ABP8WUL1_9MICO|nr:hypothetical protein [Promicromonospora umidemergens]MCP2283603.1 hypothetical protein [Promicromonospora umidemergens]